MDIISLLLMTPVIGAIVILACPETAGKFQRWTAIAASSAALGMAAALPFLFDRTSGGFQFCAAFAWIPSLGINYKVGVDGISVLLIPAASLAALACVIAIPAKLKTVKEYYFWILVAQTAVTGCFASRDLFLFMAFWQAAAAPAYFLMQIFSDKEQAAAPDRFFFYQMTGGALLLGSIIAMYVNSPVKTFDIDVFAGNAVKFTDSFHFGIFIAMLSGLAVRIPIFPLHSWIKETHVKSPGPVSIITGVLLPATSLYAIISILIPITGKGFPAMTDWLAIPAIINILYAALAARRQQSAGAAIAYTAMSWNGYALLGIAALTMEGIAGAGLMLVSQLCATSMLFLTAEGESSASDEGPQFLAPALKWMAAIGMVTMMALPFSANFTGIFMACTGSFDRYPWLVALALAGLLLNAACAVNLGERYLWKAQGTQNKKISLNIWIAILPLTAAALAIGFFPGIFLNSVSITAKTFTMMFK